MASEGSDATTLVIYSRTGNQGKQSSHGLRQFYLKMYEYITDFGMPDEEVKDIQLAIEELLHKIKEEFGKKYPHFRTKDIVGAGSYYENTKILRPDEFDFLYVLEDLSNDTLVEMKKIHLAEMGGVEVKLKDEEYFLNGPWLVDTNSDGELYLSFYQFLSDKNVLYMKEPVEYFSKAFVNATGHLAGLRSDQKYGQLNVSGIESTNGPNVEIWYEWKSKSGKTATVKSDLTPVIRAFNLEDMVSAGDCMSAKYFEKLKARGSYFVMPSKVRHLQAITSFSPTFTETERDIMLELNDSHRVTYRCLKFLLLDIFTSSNAAFLELKQFGHPELFQESDFRLVLRKIDYLSHRSFLSTFCLKTALLTHTCTCDNDAAPELCALDVIEILLRGAECDKPYLSNIFNKDNLFWKYSLAEYAGKLKNLRAYLSVLRSFHHMVMKDTALNSEELTPESRLRKVMTVLVNLTEENSEQLAEEISFTLPTSWTNLNAFKYSQQDNKPIPHFSDWRLMLDVSTIVAKNSVEIGVENYECKASEPGSSSMDGRPSKT